MRKPALLSAPTLTLLVLSSASDVSADPPAGSADPPAGERGEVTGDATEFVFDDDLVPGDLARPLGEVLQTRWRPGGGGLIHVRDQFIDHLLRSIEDL